MFELKAIPLVYATLLERQGNTEKAEEDFAFAKERSLGTLQYYTKIGENFPKAQMYMYPLQLMQQYYSQKGDMEKVQQLGQDMQTISPSLRQ